MQGCLHNINDLKLEMKEIHYLESFPPNFFVLIRCIPQTCTGLQVKAPYVFENTLDHFELVLMPIIQR